VIVACRIAIAAIVVLVAAPAVASPNVSLDDPIYDRLAALRARGELSSYLGGFRPLTWRRAHALLVAAGGSDQEPPPGWWVAPVERAAARVSVIDEQVRPYSTAIRPRDLTGAIALSCEHEEGRPCGAGAGLVTELDSSAGYGPWLSGAIRVRARAGTSGLDEGVDLDRAYVNAELGPLAVEAGRDVLVLGPASRTQLAWGDHAPPLDHVRISTAAPFALGSAARGNLLYVVGRLRAPQTFPGNLVTIARGQLDIANTVELGMSQLLQLGGEGARSLGLVDFVLEHVRRRDKSAGPTDSSNRRVSFDVSAQIPELAGARFYYELVFEDLRRKRWMDAVRYDADHLVGVELAAIGPGRRHGLVVEWQQTGVRSQEHTPRTTGFTNAGRVVGSPLGPDAQSLYVGGRIALGRVTVRPWGEVAGLSSDTYTFVDHGPITRATVGVTERRYRAGLGGRLAIRRGWILETEAIVEHVSSFAFEPGAHRNNVGATASVIWQP